MSLYGSIASTVEFPVIMKRHITFNKNGLTKANYARSADDILDKYPSSSNGNYWIDPTERNLPQLIQCDMTGGGWMIVPCLQSTTQQGASKRNLFLSNWGGHGYYLRSVAYAGQEDYTGTWATTDPDGIQHSAGQTRNEGFYTRSGNNSYNVTVNAVILDKTGILGSESLGPNWYHDCRAETYQTNLWGWAPMYFEEAFITYDGVVQTPGTNPPIRDARGMMYALNNSSNNGTYWNFGRGDTGGAAGWSSGGSPSTPGIGYGNEIWFEKIGTAGRFGRNTTPFTGGTSATATAVRNWAGAFSLFGGQSPSGVEYRQIQVKSLYSGEVS